MANQQTSSTQPRQTAKPQEPEWRIAWEQTQKSPEYQNADNDMEREAMRMEVFRDYVAPHLRYNQLDEGFQLFNEQTRPKGDPTSGIAGDTAAAVKSGLWSVGGDIASAFTLGDPNAVSLGMKARSEEAWEQASPTAIAEAAAFGVDYKEGEGLGGFSFKPGSTLYGMGMNAVKGGVSMAPMFVGGGVFGLGAKGIARVAGVTRKTRDAIAAGNKAKAMAAMKQADSITRATQFTGQSALMGGMIGGGTSNQAFEEVYNQPEEVLKQSEIYNGYLDQGMSREQARDTLARDAAKAAFGGGFTLGAASGGVYGRFLDKMLKGGLGATTRLGNAGRGALGEGLQETVESGGQQYLSNVAQGDVGLPVDPMKNVHSAAATGTILGAAMGGPMGGFSKGRKAPDLDDVTRNLDAAEASANTLETELSGELDPETRVRKEADLEKTYRQIMDYRAIARDLKENPPKQQKTKKEQPAEQKPAAETAATPKAAEQDTEPLESEASWVDTDVDLKIAELSRDVRQAESNMRRSDQNGAGIDDHRLLERDLGQKRALLERLKALSFNRDKQHYFENREAFYDWIDRSIGTDQEQAAARREMKHRQIRQQPGGSYPTMVTGQPAEARTPTFMEELPPELRAGMEGVLRDEAYQEATQAIPEAADIRHERQQIQRQGLANRTRDAARTRLGRHQRQQQFEQLQAQHEQQTRSQPSLAEQKTAATAGKSEQRETETDERAVQQSPEPTAKPGRFEATSERQRARLRYLRERLEKTASEAGKRAATLLRSASAAMATHGNQTVTIDGHTLTIKRGRVDRDEFNRFTRALGAKAPRTRAQHTSTVTNAAARTIQTIRDRYARLDDASSKKLVKMADTVIFTLEKRGVLTQKYGDNVLRIDPGGKVSAQDLRKFRQWLEGPENTSTGYWKQIIRERADKLGKQPHRAAMARTALLAISQKETRSIPYGNKQTLTFKRGEADHNDLLEFTSWLNPGRATPEPAAEPRKHPSGRGSLTASTKAGLEQKARQQQKEQARRQQYADYFHNRVRKAMANNNQAVITIGALTDSHQEFADVNRDNKKKAALGRVVINALKNGRTDTIEFGDTLPRNTLTIRHGKAKNSDLDALISYLASTRIPEKPKAPPALTGPSFADEATHIWTNPETGERVPVIYEGRSDYDMDLYLDENGEEYIGDQSQFQPTGNRNAATEAEANRQQKEKELAELDRQDREKERQAREQAAEDEQKRRDAQRQAEEQAAIEKEQKELQAEENLQREAEEKIKRDKEQLEIEKQEIDQVNAEWEPERQRKWAERRKQDTGGEEGPAKLSWKHSRLVNANIIGNSKGEGFTKEYQAKSALSQKQLEDTHFVFQTFAGDFFLKRKEQLEPASKPVEKQKPAPDVSEKTEKVSTSEERVKETAESEQVAQPDTYTMTLRGYGRVTFNVINQPTLNDGETLLQSDIITGPFKTMQWGQKVAGLPATVNAWRISTIQRQDGSIYGRAEYSDENKEGTSYFSELDNVNQENLHRINQTIQKQLVKRVTGLQPSNNQQKPEAAPEQASTSPLDDITPPVSSKLKDLNPENAASVAEEVAANEAQVARWEKNDGEANAAEMQGDENNDFNNVSYAYRRMVNRGPVTATEIRKINRFFSGVQGMQALQVLATENSGKPINDLIPIIIDTATNPDAGMHVTDSGQIEEIDGEVIRDALEDAESTPKFDDITEARKWLVNQIDKAIKAAPEEAEPNNFIRFSVPGDGTFRVKNSKDRLTFFKKQVEKSGGFKKPVKRQTSKPKGGGSFVANMKEFLQDGEYENAYWYAKNHGKSLLYGKNRNEDTLSVYVPTGEIDIHGITFITGISTNGYYAAIYPDASLSASTSKDKKVFDEGIKKLKKMNRDEFLKLLKRKSNEGKDQATLEDQFKRQHKIDEYAEETAPVTPPKAKPKPEEKKPIKPQHSLTYHMGGSTFIMELPKKPWEMTIDEIKDVHRKWLGPNSSPYDALKAHANQVKLAFERGETIPASVQYDWKDLSYPSHPDIADQATDVAVDVFRDTGSHEQAMTAYRTEVDRLQNPQWPKITDYSPEKLLYEISPETHKVWINASKDHGQYKGKANGWDLIFDNFNGPVSQGYILQTPYQRTEPAAFATEAEARQWAKEHKANRKGYYQSSAPKQPDVGDTAPPTGVKKRRLKRNTRRAELDEDMQKANKELAEAFRSALSAPSSSAAFVLEKVLPLSIRMGSLYVQKGYLKFADWADNMLYGLDAEGIDPEDVLPHLKAIYAATKQNATDDQYDRMDSEGDVRRFDLDSLFEEESTDSTGESHVSITGSNLERDSRGSGTETQVGQENVPHDSGRTGSTDGRTGRQDGEGRGGEQRDTGLSEAGTTAGGTRSDTDVLEDHGSYGDEGRPADSGERSGSRDPGRKGTHAERRADQQVENAAAATGKLTLEQKVELQEKADSIPTKHGDLQNIRDTLPVLLPEQQEDVLKGETRLYTNGEAGMLFTNGTGTGKTFTGLGHIKRLARDGKDSILIMAPSDKVANDWIQSGKLLGLDITQLKNTRDAGKGVVVTTYENAGINDSLVHRNWDMVVADESHKLMQNAEGDETLSLKTLRAITMNPRGIHSRHAMLMADEIAQYQELGQSIDNLTKMANLDDTMDQVRDAYLKEAEQKTEQRTALGKKLDAHLEKVRNEVGAINKKDRTKVLFLSATPFAYHKNIPYADGYLFDIYGTEPDRHTGYNEPGAFERFFVENFGYRMRYNKLTAPDKDVDVGLMEREFNQKLKDSGALSGRRLEVDADYSREFVLVEDAIGQKIDEGIELIRTDKRLSKLQSLLDGKFDYLKQVQMLEAIKASHAVERIMKHQALGRKVVVFHNFKVGGTQNPFMFRKGTDRDVNDAIDLFNDLRPDLAKLEMNLPSPIITLQQAFPDLLLFNGDVKKSERRANADKFNDDNNPGAVILVQRAAGKEGVSLHDTTGKHQRVLMDLGLPGAPTDLIQTEGRIYRVGQVTNAIDEYLVTGTNFEKYAFANKVASRASTAENLALGHEGRQLQPAIIEAFKDMNDIPPSEKQGSGGKDFDRQNSEVSYYDRAKTYYFARMKRTSKNKSAEGTDYFATPEPAGLKMFEMAGIRRGESMLEPSAGHGAIARWFPEFTRNTFIEPSYKLAAELGLNSNGKILNQDFESLALVNKFDGIVMNPPFGVGGKTADEHVEKAMKHTRDGGRIVALIPVGPAADKRFAKLEESETARDFYKVAEILLPPVMFKRAGTSVMGKIVVWEKQEGENNPSQLQQKNRDFTGITEIKELFDRLEDFTLPDRLPPEPKKTKAVEGEISLTNEMGNETTFSVMDSQHTKTGAPLYVVNMEGTLLDDQYKAISALAREKNGYYIKANLRNFYKPPFGVTPKGKPTFTFKNDEDRNDFLAGLQEMSAAPQAETDSRYRLAEPGARGIKPYQSKTLQKQLDKALGNIVTVVQSESDLPQNLRDQIAHDGVSGQVKGIFDSSNNHTYVIADRAADMNDALATALHETVGHLGVRSVLGTALDSTLDRIYQSIPRNWKSSLRIAYASQLKGKSRIDQNRLIAEEYLAHLAETNPSHGWVRQAVALIRKLLRRAFPSLMKWTGNDIRQLLMDARKFAGQKGPAIAADIRYQSDEVAIQVNIRKGKQAAKRVLKSHIDVTSAMHRPGIGDIDFIWGTAGKWPPKGKGQARKGQKGIAHIIEARMRKNKLSESEAKEVLNKVIETIAKGYIDSEEKKKVIVNGKPATNHRVKLRMGDYVAQLINENLENQNHYLLSGFEESASDDAGMGQGKTRSTLYRPTPRRSAEGAEADSNLNDRPTSGQGKPAVIRYQLASLDSISQAEMKKKALSTVSEAKEFSRNNLLGFFGGKQLAEMYGNIFDKVSDTIGHNPLKQLDKLLQKMTSERSNYASQAEKMDQRWSKLARTSPAVYNLLSSVMHRSTLWQQDPREDFKLAGDKSIKTLREILDNPASEKQRFKFQKQLDNELARKAQYDQLKKDWEILSRTEEAAKLYTDVENFYRRQWKDTKKALIEKVNGTQLDPHAKRSARAEIELMFHKALNGPYFPLMRFGDYVITATNAEGGHYRAHYETKTAMQEARADLEKQGYSIKFTGMRQDFNPRDMAGVGKFSAQVSRILYGKMGDSVPDTEKAAILSEINQITLELMPEMSSAKRSLHRKNVPGYHENARRAFDATSLTQANRISRIRYGWQMEAEIDKMMTVASQDESDSPLTTDERIKARQVASEMSKRHDEIMNPKGNAISAAATNFGFFMYMGGSIGAGLVNMTQNLLIGLPQMASQYGFRNTARVMAQVTKDYFGKGGKMPKDLDGLLQNSWFSLENARGIPADERALIRTLVRDGTIETTQAHVLAQMADMDIKPEAVKKKDWYVKLTRASGMFFHNAEVANRQIAALTAYRLAKQKGQTTTDASGNPDEATVDKIRKAVFDAHYDYSSTNRPRYFRSNWAKVFLLFKQYSQNTLFFLGRNFHEAIKGESPEIKQQARKTLGTTFAMHGIFAGALGLPTASVWLGLAGLFMGDEDDPVDPEVALRNGLASLFGREVAHAMSKGLFNALLGIDIHSRTSANDLLFRSSDYDMSARQEAQSFVTSALGGPLVSQGINMYASIDRMASGETWQGLEGLMPKFIRDGMRAVRYNTEGMQNSQGKTLLDDFSLWETGWKLGGISSARESEVYDLNKAVTGARKAIERRRSLLMESYYRADTSQERQQVQQQIYAFNDAQKARQRDWAEISPKQLKASVKSRQRTREEAKHGIYLREAQLGMMDWGRFADI